MPEPMSPDEPKAVPPRLPTRPAVAPAFPSTPIPTAAPTQVVVEGRPVAAADPGPPDSYSPYREPDEIVPGGQYVRGARPDKGKLFGGEVVDAHGNVLATFEPDQENDGNPDSGKKPEPSK